MYHSLTFDKVPDSTIDGAEEDESSGEAESAVSEEAVDDDAVEEEEEFDGMSLYIYYVAFLICCRSFQPSP